MDVAHKALPAQSERTRAFREWIEAILAAKRINQTELAHRAGLSHSTLSRAMTKAGYRINFRADTIAKLAEVGGMLPPQAIVLRASDPPSHGFSEPQATLFKGDKPDELPSGQSQWTCHTNIMTPMGIMPGDHFILDQNVKPQYRDIVVIQNYDHQTGTAETLLRVFADGFGFTPTYLADGTPRLYLDGSNATVMGVITKSWRSRT